MHENDERSFKKFQSNMFSTWENTLASVIYTKVSNLIIKLTY